MSTTTTTKPKRQLTEAQRLAFMKGREKRMANLLKKKEEKLEAEMLSKEEDVPTDPETESEPEMETEKSKTPEPPTPPPVAKKVRKTKTKPEIIPVAEEKTSEVDPSNLAPVMTVEDRDLIISHIKNVENKYEDIISRMDKKATAKSKPKENVESVQELEQKPKRPRARSVPPPEPTTRSQFGGNLFSWA